MITSVGFRPTSDYGMFMITVRFADEVDDVIKVVSENATNIASAYIQRKSRAYKTLRIHGHSSVLAIQYVVLKKCMNEKTCK